jgi:hypothetical protein
MRRTPAGQRRTGGPARQAGPRSGVRVDALRPRTGKHDRRLLRLPLSAYRIWTPSIVRKRPCGVIVVRMQRSSRCGLSFEPVNTPGHPARWRCCQTQCVGSVSLSKGSDAVAEVEFERATALQALREQGGRTASRSSRIDGARRHADRPGRASAAARPRRCGRTRRPRRTGGTGRPRFPSAEAGRHPARSRRLPSRPVRRGRRRSQVRAKFLAVAATNTGPQDCTQGQCAGAPPASRHRPYHFSPVRRRELFAAGRG